MRDPVVSYEEEKRGPADQRPRRTTFTEKIGKAFRTIYGQQNAAPAPLPVTGLPTGGSLAIDNDSQVMDQSSSESEEETVLHHRPMTLNQVRIYYLCANYTHTLYTCSHTHNYKLFFRLKKNMRS